MRDCDLLVVHATELFTPVEGLREGNGRAPAGAVSGSRQDEADRFPDGALAIEGEIIAEAGPTRSVLGRWRSSRVLDAAGLTLTPAFCDPHTHLAFAGWRAEEFARRVSGRPQAGLETGIPATARATAAASDDELRRLIRSRLDDCLRAGTTLVEVKSGYALTIEGELRLLRLIREAATGHPVDVVSTVLAAHALPAEYHGRPAAYLDEVAWPVTEEARRQGLAQFVDAFVEDVAFPASLAEPYLARARQAGWGVRVHADQLASSGGARLAAALGAASADHLERATAEDARALAPSGTVAVLLPGASLTLDGTGGARPPVRELAAAGVPIALGTDFNPGTSTVSAPALCLGLACRLFGLSPEAAWAAFTVNAAASLGQGGSRGRLAAGFRADVCAWEMESAGDLAYRLDAHRPRWVLARGRMVAEEARS